MKKLMIICAVLLTASTSFAQKAKANKSKDNTPTYTVYSCSMHPEVAMDKPGNCPKCGMTLEATFRSDAVDVNGERRDTHQFVILRQDWQARNPQFG